MQISRTRPTSTISSEQAALPMAERTLLRMRRQSLSFQSCVSLVVSQAGLSSAAVLWAQMRCHSCMLL